MGAPVQPPMRRLICLLLKTKPDRQDLVFGAINSRTTRVNSRVSAIVPVTLKEPQKLPLVMSAGSHPNDCPHRMIPSICSDRSRAVVPIDPDHPFRGIPISLWSAGRSVTAPVGLSDRLCSYCP